MPSTVGTVKVHPSSITNLKDFVPVFVLPLRTILFSLFILQLPRFLKSPCDNNGIGDFRSTEYPFDWTDVVDAVTRGATPSGDHHP